MKKLVALLLTGAMAASLLPQSALAATLTLGGSQKTEETSKGLTLKKQEGETTLSGGLKITSSTGTASMAASSAEEATVRAMGIVPEGTSLTAKVTRAQFARMLTLASPYRNSVSGSAGLSLFKDVKYTNEDSGYIKIAVSNGWMSGYIDGTFRPGDTVALEEAATALIKMLGYTAEDLVGAYPDAQINKFKALGLSSGTDKQKGQALTNGDCASIFYDLMGAKTKEGQIYAATLGYAMNADGSVNYLSMITEDLKGPYVVSSDSKWTSVLPFSISGATVYYNGSKAKASEISKYDVIYYNENSKTVWAYDNRVSGLITAITPGGLSPSAVTIGGVSYNISSSTAAYKLSSMGSYHTGDVVTLILGMNNDVVDVITSDRSSGYAFGVILNVESISYRDEDGSQITAELITLKNEDGVTEQFINKGDFYGISSGAVVIKYSGIIVKDMEALSEVELEYIGGRKDVTDVDGNDYEVGANAAVFTLQNGAYSPTTLSSAKNLLESGATVYGYCDDVLKDDGKLHVIVVMKP